MQARRTPERRNLRRRWAAAVGIRGTLFDFLFWGNFGNVTLPLARITLALTLVVKVLINVTFMTDQTTLTVDQALDALGWSQAELARRLDVHENTVIQWKAMGAPGYAQAYLRLAMDVRALGQEVEPRARVRRK